MNPPVCPACGARLASGSTQCDLCGHVLGDENAAEPERRSSEPEPVASAPEASDAASNDPSDKPGGRFCVHCGVKNPDYARFCYQCGQALHGAGNASRPGAAPEGSVPIVASTPVVPASVPEGASAVPGVRPDSDAGKRALALVGIGVMVVLALFFITRASQNSGSASPSAASAGATGAAQQQAAPDQLPEDIAARAASLEEEIAAATDDEERIAMQETLAGLYTQAGAFSRAAVVQEEVAEARQTALAWADAGSLYLAHMLRTQGPERANYAQLAAETYERALALDPNDLDVKTDLATAYLNDQTNPMRAVETVKEVLDADPNHVRANFNYGLMLAQINRVDQAMAQFEKVVALTDHDDPVHQRAEQEMARMQTALGGTSSG